MMNKNSNPLSRIIVLAFFMLACALSGFAQKRYCQVPPPSPFKHNALISTRYDKPTKRMKTVLEHPLSLGHSSSDELYLSASFFYSDPRLRTRPMLDIALISVSKERKYRDSHDVVLLADGMRLALVGPVQYQSGKGDKGLAQEVTHVTITYDTLFKLIGAKRVTALLGGTQFELTSNHLESLREIASLMAPQERDIILASRLGNRAARQMTNH
jgi:hypothetical protein